MTQPDPIETVPAGTSTGLAPNVSGALAYLLGPITGIIFLVLEKRSSYVRFHAAQSIGIWVAFFAVSIVLSVLMMILTQIPVIGVLIGIAWFLVSMFLGLGGFLLWIFLMYKGYSGDEWEFPWVGRQVRQVLLKGSV
jgi:uncharacterized membrane protein